MNNQNQQRVNNNPSTSFHAPNSQSMDLLQIQQQQQQYFLQQQQEYFLQQKQLQKQFEREELRNRLKNMNVKTMGAPLSPIYSHAFPSPSLPYNPYNPTTLVKDSASINQYQSSPIQSSQPIRENSRHTSKFVSPACNSSSTNLSTQLPRNSPTIATCYQDNLVTTPEDEFGDFTFSGAPVQNRVGSDIRIHEAAPTSIHNDLLSLSDKVSTNAFTDTFNGSTMYLDLGAPLSDQSLQLASSTMNGNPANYVPGSLTNDDSDVFHSVEFFSNPLKTEEISDINSSESDSLIQLSSNSEVTDIPSQIIPKVNSKHFQSSDMAASQSSTSADWRKLDIGDVFSKTPEDFRASFTTLSDDMSNSFAEPLEDVESFSGKPFGNINGLFVKSSEDIGNLFPKPDDAMSKSSDTGCLFAKFPEAKSNASKISYSISPTFIPHELQNNKEKDIFPYDKSVLSTPSFDPMSRLFCSDENESETNDLEWSDYQSTNSKYDEKRHVLKPLSPSSLELPTLYKDIIEFCITSSGVIDVSKVYQVMLTEEFTISEIQPLMEQCNMISSPKEKDLINLIGLVGMKQSGHMTPLVHQLRYDKLLTPKVNCSILQRSKPVKEKNQTLLSFVETKSSDIGSGIAPLFELGDTSSNNIIPSTLSNFELLDLNQESDNVESNNGGLLGMYPSNENQFSVPVISSESSEESVNVAPVFDFSTSYTKDLASAPLKKNKAGEEGKDKSLIASRLGRVDDVPFPSLKKTSKQQEVNLLEGPHISSSPNSTKAFFQPHSMGRNEKSRFCEKEIASEFAQFPELNHPYKESNDWGDFGVAIPVEDNVLGDFRNSKSSYLAFQEPKQEKQPANHKIPVAKLDEPPPLVDNDEDDWADFTHPGQNWDIDHGEINILVKNNIGTKNRWNIGSTPITEPNEKFANFDDEILNGSNPDSASSLATEEPVSVMSELQFDSSNSKRQFKAKNFDTLDPSVDDTKDDTAEKVVTDIKKEEYSEKQGDVINESDERYVSKDDHNVVDVICDEKHEIVESLKLQNLPQKDLDGFWNDMVDSLGPKVESFQPFNFDFDGTQNITSDAAAAALEYQSYESVNYKKSVSYDAFKDDDYSTEEDRLGAWSKCLSLILTILLNCHSILGSSNSSLVHQEILQSEKGSCYMQCCTEVFKVASRISISGASEDGILEIFKEIKHTWTLISELLDEFTVLPTLREFNLKPHSSLDVIACKNCSICLLDTESETSSHNLEYNGKFYHVSCANFWINSVNPLLPDLKPVCNT